MPHALRHASGLALLLSAMALGLSHPARAADCLDSQSAARIAGKLVNEMFTMRPGGRSAPGSWCWTSRSA